jgi:programmed cell death protein 5
MDELEAIRARKLQQLQQQSMQQEQQKQLQIQEALRQIDALVRRFLTPEAQDRLTNLKMVDPELVQKLKIYLAQMYASGKIKKMDDGQLKELLMKLRDAGKRDINIKRI